MFKQNLSSYEKGLVKVLFALIAVVLEVVFVYQYMTSGTVTFSPTAMLSGDGAFYFVVIGGIVAGGYLPHAVSEFRRALKE